MEDYGAFAQYYLEQHKIVKVSFPMLAFQKKSQSFTIFKVHANENMPFGYETVMYKCAVKADNHDLTFEENSLYFCNNTMFFSFNNQLYMFEDDTDDNQVIETFTFYNMRPFFRWMFDGCEKDIQVGIILQASKL